MGTGARIVQRGEMPLPEFALVARSVHPDAPGPGTPPRRERPARPKDASAYSLPISNHICTPLDVGFTLILPGYQKNLKFSLRRSCRAPRIRLSDGLRTLSWGMTNFLVVLAVALSADDLVIA